MSHGDTIEPLPDLCEHSDYRIYVNGQLVEVVGRNGYDAQFALQFWQEAARRRLVEPRTTECSVAGCTGRA